MNIKNYNKGKYKKEIDKLVNKLNEEKEKYNNLFIESCRKMIEVNPNNIESYKEKIDFLKSTGKNDLVIECYDKMIEVNPNNIESYKEKINFLKQLADQNNNLIIVKKYISSNKEKCEKEIDKLLNKLNEEKEKYYNSAIKCYDEAINLKPSIDLYEGKAQILDLLKRYSEAEECRKLSKKLKI